MTKIVDNRVGIYYHRCTATNNQVSKVDVKPSGWAVGIDFPELTFPVYKDCCKFYKDEELTGEVDMSDFMPTLDI